jgi:ferredoxin
MIFSLVHLYRDDPALLEKRMRTKEKEGTQRKSLMLSLPLSVIALLIPGRDYRFGSSHVSLWLSLAALAVMIGSCERVCPLDVRITEYLREHRRVSCSECIICQSCAAAGPRALVLPRVRRRIPGPADPACAGTEGSEERSFRPTVAAATEGSREEQ